MAETFVAFGCFRRLKIDYKKNLLSGGVSSMSASATMCLIEKVITSQLAAITCPSNRLYSNLDVAN
jgi:hypothetical protein